jgi:hypothetical protein
VFTYSVADIGTVTLQSMTTPSEFKAMRASLDKDLAERPLTPLQKVQYQHLKELVDNGEEGWVEIVVVPSGGVLSPPRPGENYMTGVAIQQVGECRCMNGYQALTCTLPLVTACIWNRLSCQ